MRSALDGSTGRLPRRPDACFPRWCKPINARGFAGVDRASAGWVRFDRIRIGWRPSAPVGAAIVDEKQSAGFAARRWRALRGGTGTCLSADVESLVLAIKHM